MSVELRRGCLESVAGIGRFGFDAAVSSSRLADGPMKTFDQSHLRSAGLQGVKHDVLVCYEAAV